MMKYTSGFTKGAFVIPNKVVFKSSLIESSKKDDYKFSSLGVATKIISPSNNAGETQSLYGL